MMFLKIGANARPDNPTEHCAIPRGLEPELKAESVNQDESLRVKEAIAPDFAQTLGEVFERAEAAWKIFLEERAGDHQLREVEPRSNYPPFLLYTDRMTSPPIFTW